MKTVALPDVAEVVGDPPQERPWLDAGHVRERAGNHLLTVPTKELWKYTPIKPFLDELARLSAGSPAALDGIDQPGVRAVPLDTLDGDDAMRVRRAVSERLDGARHVLADLALLRAGGGWFVQVSATAGPPLEIRIPQGGVAPLFLVLEPGAELTLVERMDAEGFLAQVALVELGPGARLHHYRAALARDVGHYSLLQVHLAQDARYRLNQNCVAGNRRRAEVHVLMDGPGADADLAGAYLVEPGQHLDQQFVVEHRAGHTTSRQKFHGIGAGKGRSVFNGRIHIHPDSPASDAQLSNRNLALHPDVEMDTKPELEIYTDDVRCAHGATVGQLALESLFYLTSRGVPEPAARRLLSHGFVRECMAGPLAEASAVRFMEAL